MLFSVVQLFNGNVILLKVRALGMGYPVYFRLQATFFYQRCRASMTKHRQQTQGLELKEQIHCGVRFVLLCYKLRDNVFGYLNSLPEPGHVIPGWPFSKMVNSRTDTTLERGPLGPSPVSLLSFLPTPFLPLALSSTWSSLPPDSGDSLPP